jgi:outer membrane protein assembly factor BamB
VKFGAHICLAIAALPLLASCGVVKSVAGGSGPKTTPTVGNRVDILGTEASTDADPALANLSVVLPPAELNAAWAQPGGNAEKSPGHLQLGNTLTQAWSASVAAGTSRARLASTPVVSDGRLYVVDTSAMVTAFDANTGSRLWATSLAGEKGTKDSLFGGGVSSNGPVVFATNGIGDVAAINAENGTVIWKKRPAGPLRGAPTLSNDNVYVMTQDNQIYAIRQADGEAQWNESGPVGVSGIFGVAAPAAAQGTVIAGYSTGELSAYRYENGRTVWNDTLSRTAMSTSVSTLTDIDADPVIDRGRVFALGKGGRMAAYELVTGQRIWEINIGGIATPLVAGEWVFVLTDDAKLLAVARNSGKIRWISKLQRYQKEKNKSGQITWRGPVLAGGRLIATNSRGEIWSIAPEDGTATKIVDAKRPISVPPIVANAMLFVLDDNGKISAFR